MTLTAEQLDDLAYRQNVFKDKFKNVLIEEASQDTTIHIELNNFQIRIKKTSDGIYIEIENDELLLRSVRAIDYESLYSLYANPEVMKLFHYGRPKTREEVDFYLQLWSEYRKQNTPYGAFAVYYKDKKHEFAGLICLDHNGDYPGLAELVYLLMPEIQGKGIGTKITDIVLNHFLPIFVLLSDNIDLRGKKLSAVIATARTDNPASQKILQKFMQKNKDIPGLYGMNREEYRVSVQELSYEFLIKNPNIIVNQFKSVQVSASPSILLSFPLNKEASHASLEEKGNKL